MPPKTHDLEGRIPHSTEEKPNISDHSARMAIESASGLHGPEPAQTPQANYDRDDCGSPNTIARR